MRLLSVTASCAALCVAVLLLCSVLYWVELLTCTSDRSFRSSLSRVSPLLFPPLLGSSASSASPGFPSSTSLSSAGADGTASPLLRAPLAHHAYASLMEKLHRGEPVRVAILGGSISEGRGWFIRERPDLGYFALLMDWMNAEFPVSPLVNSSTPPAWLTPQLRRRLSAFDALIDHREPARYSSPFAHKLANFAAGGTGTQSASFCWASLFTDSADGSTAMPDLLLIDYTVNDAYMLAGSIAEDVPSSAPSSTPAFPLSPLHSLDRLLRSVLLTGAKLQHPIAVLLLYFAAASRWHYRSVQSMHDRVARHYGVHAVHWRDHRTQRAVRVPFPVQEPGGFDDGGGRYFDGDETIHPNPQGHWVMGQLLIRTLTALYDNYFNSQRASLADLWLLSGKLASTSRMLKDRPSARWQQQDEVTELNDTTIDRGWRIVTDIDGAAVQRWQERLLHGDADAEPILPPLLSLPPLPLPRRCIR